MQQVKRAQVSFLHDHKDETDDRRHTLRRSCDREQHAVCIRVRLLVGSLVILNLVVLTGLYIIVTTLE